MPGSRATPPRSCSFDGSPSSLRRCVAPAGVSAGAVSDHYAAVARAESQLPGPAQSDRGPERPLGPAAGFPVVVKDDETGMHVVWTSVKDGRRKGVVVSENAGMVAYSLIESEPLAAEPAGRPVLLPGGIRAPEGAQPGLLFDGGDTGLGCLELGGAPPDAARRLVQSLESAGYALDARTLEEIDAVNPAGQRIVLPFRGNGRNGWVVVSSARPGVSRATLTLR